MISEKKDLDEGSSSCSKTALGQYRDTKVVTRWMTYASHVDRTVRSRACLQA